MKVAPAKLAASTGRKRYRRVVSVHHCSLYYTTLLGYNTMLLRQTARLARTAAPLSSLAQRRLASSLVFLEHKGGKLNDSSLHAVTAAQKVDGEVS